MSMNHSVSSDLGTAYFDKEADELAAAVISDLDIDEQDLYDYLYDYCCEYLTKDTTLEAARIDSANVNVTNEDEAKESIFVIYAQKMPDPFKAVYDSPEDYETEIRATFPKDKFPKVNTFLDSHPILDHMGYVSISTLS